jgi:hypothetical protein
MTYLEDLITDERKSISSYGEKLWIFGFHESLEFWERKERKLKVRNGKKTKRKDRIGKERIGKNGTGRKFWM